MALAPWLATWLSHQENTEIEGCWDIAMLKGKHVQLRLLRHADECRQWLTAYNDLSQRAETDHTEIKALPALLQEFNQTGLWGEARGTMVITNSEDVPIGTISFVKRSELELEVGYRIWQRSQRGQGYISEALPLFSAYLFETQPIRRLRIQTTVDNIGSRRVAEKSGYREEGIIRQAYFYRGEIRDQVIYGLLREESPSLAELLACRD